MPQRPAVLQPATADMLRAEHLPQLPAWYPLDPAPTDECPHPQPLTSAEREHLRGIAQVNEAVEGPFDGQRMVVAWAEGGEPPVHFVPVSQPTLRYVLDRQASNQHRLVYRYDPTCYLHQQLMRAVEAGYRELDPHYAEEARQDDQDAPFYERQHGA